MKPKHELWVSVKKTSIGRTKMKFMISCALLIIKSRKKPKTLIASTQQKSQRKVTTYVAYAGAVRSKIKMKISIR